MSGYKKCKRKESSSETPQIGSQTLRSVSDICEEVYDQQLRGEAMQYMPGAVEKLAKLAESGPAAVARAAANDLIALGAEKPKSKDDLIFDRIGGQTFNITVVRFENTGKPIELPVEQVQVPAVAADIEDAQVVDALPEGAAAPAAMFNFATPGKITAS